MFENDPCKICSSSLGQSVLWSLPTISFILTWKKLWYMMKNVLQPKHVFYKIFQYSPKWQLLFPIAQASILCVESHICHKTSPENFIQAFKSLGPRDWYICASDLTIIGSDSGLLEFLHAEKDCAVLLKVVLSLKLVLSVVYSESPRNCSFNQRPGNIQDFADRV